MGKKNKRKVNKVSELVIQYKAPEVVLVLDRAAEKLAKQLGLKFSGSGYDFRTKIRDVSFN